MNVKIPAAAAIRSILADVSHWSQETHVPISHIVSAALGMAIPVAAGIAIKQPGLGMLASLGGLALSGAAGDGTLRRQCGLLGYALATSLLAVLAGSFVGGHGWMTGIAIVAIAFFAALISGISRTAARSGGMFMVMLIIGSSIDTTDPIGIALVFMIGAAWTMAVTLAASVFFRAMGIEQALSSGQQPASPSIDRIMRHWIRTLYHPAGWQYALRIGLCLAAAETVAFIWDQHWSYWIAIVVVIIVQRSFRSAIARAFQRTVGTFAGVLIASILLLWFPPAYLLVLIIGLLSALRPFLRAHNYTLYAAVMTPLIIIVLQFGDTLSAVVIAYRLIDTVIGFFIVLVLGYLIWPSTHRKTEALKPGDNKT